MLRFHSSAFLSLLDQLQQAEQFIRAQNIPANRVSIERKQGWHKIMKTMMAASTEIGLRTVPSHLRYLLIGGPELNLTEDDLRRAISSTHDMLVAELSSQLMLIVPYPDDALFIGTGPAFGDDVYKAFPSARFDIDEASKCLALDRSTACVLHLMRSLESGMNVLAKTLHIPFAHANWEQVLNKIPIRIKEIENAKRKPKGWRELRQFYAEAGTHLSLVKDAFRNWAMHIHKTYDPVTAKELFQHSKAFLRHLSSQLHE
jgi:hypothetical protein